MNGFRICHKKSAHFVLGAKCKIYEMFFELCLQVLPVLCVSTVIIPCHVSFGRITNYPEQETSISMISWHLGGNAYTIAFPIASSPFRVHLLNQLGLIALNPF